MIDGAVTIGYLHPGVVSHSFSTSLLNVVMADLAGRQRLFCHDLWRLANECGSNGLVAGRNELAEAICDRSEAEWLFMVDSDMAFGSGIVEELIATAEYNDVRCVGALCFASKSDGRKEFDVVRYRSVPTVYEFVERDGVPIGVVPNMGYDRDAVIAAGATGGAAVLIHRTVFERIRERDGDEWFTPVRAGGVTFSEDLSFWLRVRSIGEPLLVNTSIKTAHHKGDLWLDEEHYDRERVWRAGQTGEMFQDTTA